MTSTTAATSLVSAVRALYEAYPYPYYPLLAKPRWEDGYASHPAFAARLARDLGQGGATDGDVLIAGSGEILPYVLRRWTPVSRALDCVDVSSRSLARARFRNALTLGATIMHAQDLDDFLADAARDGRTWAHVDAYGVVHHMPNPARTLARLAAVLAPGGTLRLMVYNTPARGWIAELQRVFALLQIDRHSAVDLAQTRNLLATWRAHLPALDARLAQLGPTTLANDARLVDTFLHAREARLGIAQWWDALARAGLVPFALLDRYAELDDLPNPLWRVPSAEALAERAADGRFENNLELFVAKPTSASLATPQPDRLTTLLALLRHPPASWSRYDETASIGWALKRELWQAHIRHVLAEGSPLSQRLQHTSTMPALQRLARLGAILPSQLEVGLRATLTLPMTKAMEAPDRAPPIALPSEVLSSIDATLARRGLTAPRRRAQLALRLERAQR